jgi:apolipoprotein N-acyltransferase
LDRASTGTPSTERPEAPRELEPPEALVRPAESPPADRRLAPSASSARRAALLAFAAGLVFAASTPPLDFQVGILVGLGGFSHAIGSWGTNDRHAPPRARILALRGFLFGLAANLVALRFVPEVITRFTPLPFAAAVLALVLLAAVQALPWAIGGAVALLVERRAGVPRWLAFATGVYAATFVPAVFPWTPAGGLTRWPLLLQAAEIVGERGVSFVVAVACGLIAESVARAVPVATALLRRDDPGTLSRLSRASVLMAAVPLAFGAGLFALLLGYGAVRARAVEAARRGAPHAKIALLEPDFDASDRWEEGRAAMMSERLTTLTRRAEANGASLTIWPESAYPYTLPHGARHAPRGARAVLQPGVRGPVLTGVYMKKGAGMGTNSAVLATSDGELSRSYDKRHLLWFGETVPFADSLPFLRRIFARGTGLAPGSEQIAFESGPVVASVLNCYEDTLPQAGREAMAVRPNVLVNITNDAWFAGSAEGELHLRLAVLRAIETRRDLVRAVNRGPTTWVSATGQVLGRREAQAGVGPPPPLVVEAALLEAPITLYARAGDAPLALLLAAALVTAWRRARLERKTGAVPVEGTTPAAFPADPQADPASRGPEDRA